VITGLAILLLSGGLLFILAAVIGILRLPDFYSRLHAMGKCDTLGVVLVLLALALHHELSLNTVKMLLIAAAVWLANPTATHALGRAALRAGFSPRLHGEEPR
jgi:multicomponent Na+:H+ antiporter subunit G